MKSYFKIGILAFAIVISANAVPLMAKEKVDKAADENVAATDQNSADQLTEKLVMPKGFEKGEKKGWKGEKTPPGWLKGEKKGWKGADMPPGLSKKTKDAEHHAHMKHEEKSKGGKKGK